MEEPLLSRTPPAARAQRQAVAWLQTALAVGVVFSHIGVGVFERVSFRLMAVSMSPYYVVLHEGLAASHLLLFAPVACVQAQCDRSSAALRRCPKHALLTMALLDTLHSLLSLYAGGRVLGAAQAVLVQAMIPATMAHAALALHTRFEMLQVAGAAVVLLAVVGVCASPGATTDASLALVADGGALGAGGRVLDLALFAAAAVPAAASAVYKRRRLMLQVIDTTYLNAWLAFFQCACGLVIGPLLFAADRQRPACVRVASTAVPYPEDALQELPPLGQSVLLRNVDEGLRCVFDAQDYEGAACPHAFLRGGLWLLASSLLAASSLGMMRLHSVPALYAVESLVPAAAALALASPALMGWLRAAAEPLSGRSALLVCVATAGLWLHHAAFVQGALARLSAPSPSATLTGDESTSGRPCSASSSAVASPDAAAGAGADGAEGAEGAAGGAPSSAGGSAHGAPGSSAPIAAPGSERRGAGASPPDASPHSSTASAAGRSPAAYSASPPARGGARGDLPMRSSL